MKAEFGARDVDVFSFKDEIFIVGRVFITQLLAFRFLCDIPFKAQKIINSEWDRLS